MKATVFFKQQQMYFNSVTVKGISATHVHFHVPSLTVEQATALSKQKDITLSFFGSFVSVALYNDQFTVAYEK